MKSSTMSLLSVLALLTLFVVAGFAAGPTERTVSGKVAAIEPEAIVVDVGSGPHMLDVGAIVQPSTMLVVKGKKTPIADLADKVKVGDMVTLKYEMTDNLYAKQIMKK